MRLIGKLLALPFVVVTGILYLVCKFLVVLSGAVLGILSGIVFLAALLFGLFRALSNVYFGFSFLVSLNIPSGVYNMLPYVISLIVLAFTSKNSRAPKAEGIPYDKGQR